VEDLYLVLTAFDSAFSKLGKTGACGGTGTNSPLAMKKGSAGKTSVSKEASLKSEYRQILNSLHKYAIDATWLGNEIGDDINDSMRLKGTPFAHDKIERIEAELERVRNEYKTYVERANEGIEGLNVENRNLSMAKE
jgi:hypothetical protein